MTPCRFCGGEADPELKRLKKGYACRACCRVHVWKRDNARPCSRRRQVRYEQSAKGQSHRKRRLFIGQNYAGKADTPELARTINAHIQRRLRERGQGAA